MKSFLQWVVVGLLLSLLIGVYLYYETGAESRGFILKLRDSIQSGDTLASVESKGNLRVKKFKYDLNQAIGIELAKDEADYQECQFYMVYRTRDEGKSLFSYVILSVKNGVVYNKAVYIASL